MFQSVFWISNANNAFHNNAAVGGEAGFWAFAHIGKVILEIDLQSFKIMTVQR